MHVKDMGTIASQAKLPCPWQKHKHIQCASVCVQAVVIGSVVCCGNCDEQKWQHSLHFAANGGKTEALQSAVLKRGVDKSVSLSYRAPPKWKNFSFAYLRDARLKVQFSTGCSACHNLQYSTVQYSTEQYRVLCMS